MRALSSVILLGICLAGSPALAQPAAPVCTATDTALPAPWSKWTAPTRVTAAATPQALDPAQLTPDAAAAATLSSATAVTYPIKPEKPVAAGSYGGLFALNIRQAGRYAIGLSTPGWLDVTRDGKAQAAKANGHGPDCSTIRKYVEFDLEPGRYVVQVSGSPEPVARIMVVRR
jgi:hypothetical protein